MCVCILHNCHTPVKCECVYRIMFVTIFFNVRAFHFSSVLPIEHHHNSNRVYQIAYITYSVCFYTATKYSIFQCVMVYFKQSPCISICVNVYMHLWLIKRCQKRFLPTDKWCICTSIAFAQINNTSQYRIGKGIYQ